MVFRDVLFHPLYTPSRQFRDSVIVGVFCIEVRKVDQAESESRAVRNGIRKSRDLLYSMQNVFISTEPEGGVRCYELTECAISRKE